MGNATERGSENWSNTEICYTLYDTINQTKSEQIAKIELRFSRVRFTFDSCHQEATRSTHTKK